MTLTILGIVLASAAFAGLVTWLSGPPKPPWAPECPLARAELQRARSICWDYEKFRYHLDRALVFERQFQAGKR